MELTEGIITAIITGAVMLVGNFLMYAKKSREDDAKQQVWEARIEARMDALETKIDEAVHRIDEHNGLVDKFREVSNNFNVAIAELRTELKMKG